MKTIVLLSFFLSFFISLATFTYAQKSTVNIVNYVNEVIAIELSSTREYSITSKWCDDPGEDSDVLLSEDEPGYVDTTIEWSKGTFSRKGNTIVCIDSRNKKKISFLQMNKDSIQVIDWKDYKNRNDVTNSHLGWNNIASNKIYIDDLLNANRFFYIRMLREKNVFTGESKLLELYNWENGVKKVLYKAEK